MSIQFKDLLGNEISINSINNVSYNINFSRDVKKVEVRNYKFPGFTPSSLRKTEIIEVELNSGAFIYIIGKQKVFEKFIYELSLSGDKCPPVKLSGKKAVKEDYFLQYVINYVAEKNSIQRTAVMDRIEIKQGFVFIGYKYHILEKDLVNVSEEILEKSFVFDDHFIKLCANFGYCDGKNKSTPKLQKQDSLSDTAQKEDKISNSQTEEIQNNVLKESTKEESEENDNNNKVVQDIKSFLEMYGSNLEKFKELERNVFNFTLASDYRSSEEGERLRELLKNYSEIEQGEKTSLLSEEVFRKLEVLNSEYSVLCRKTHSYQNIIMREKGLVEETKSDSFHRIQNQGTHIGQRNASPERRTSGITHELSLEEYVSSYKIFIDTCSLLKDDIYKFFEEIKPYLTSSSNKIIIPYRCIKELEKHTVNNLKLELNEPAKKILDYLEKLNNEGLIDIRGDKDDNFADNIFLTVFNKYRLKTNLLLITEDYRLASDINALTQQKSVESNYKIKTADLNSFYPLFKQQPRYEKDFGEIKGWTFDD